MVPYQKAVQGPEVVEEGQQEAEDQGGQEKQAEEDSGGHVEQAQVLEGHQGEQGDGDDLQRGVGQHPDAPDEDGAIPRLAVSHVGPEKPIEITEAVAQGMVTKVCVVVTVVTEVPLS